MTSVGLSFLGRDRDANLRRASGLEGHFEVAPARQLSAEVGASLGLCPGAVKVDPQNLHCLHTFLKKPTAETCPSACVCFLCVCVCVCVVYMNL